MKQLAVLFLLLASSSAFSMEIDSVDAADSAKIIPPKQTGNNDAVRSDGIESNICYPYLTDITRNGSDFWRTMYKGALSVSETYFLPLSAGFKIGIGAAYALAGFRNDFNSVHVSRYALQFKIARNFEMLSFMSLNPFAGADFAYMQFTGSGSKELPKTDEYGLGLTIGSAWMFRISKKVQIGPDVDILYNRRLVENVSACVSPSIMYVQAGLSVIVSDVFF